jgi:hypothetical protein
MAQTSTPPDAPLTPSLAGDCEKAFREVVALRETVEKFQAERAATTVERAASQALIKGLTEVIDLRSKIEATQQQQIDVLQKFIDVQTKLLETMEKRLNKPKSFFDKVLATIKTIGYILAGAALGRGL